MWENLYKSLEQPIHFFGSCTCTTCFWLFLKPWIEIKTHVKTLSNSFNQRSRNCPLHVAPAQQLNIDFPGVFIFHICTTGILHCIIIISTAFSSRKLPSTTQNQRHEKLYSNAVIWQHSYYQPYLSFYTCHSLFTNRPCKMYQKKIHFKRVQEEQVVQHVQNRNDKFKMF